MVAAAAFGSAQRCGLTPFCQWQKWRMPVSSRSRSAPGRRPWLRLALWAIPILFVLLIVAFFVVRASIESYLRSDGFRKFVAEKASNTLHADAELAPLHFSGSEIFADGFRAKGGRDAAFADLQLEQIRTEISLRRFFEKVWQVEHFEVQRLRVDLTGPRSERPVEPTANPLEAPKTERAAESSGPSGWFPNRVEIGRAVVRDTQIIWPGGGLRGTLLNVHPHEGGWQIVGQGGRIEYAKLPPLDVASLQLRYRAPSLFINSAELRQPTGGSVQATGEVDFEKQLDLHLVLVSVNTAPYLSDDWRVRMKGNLSGEVDVRSPLPLTGPPQVKGSLRLTDGELTALPVLDQIAAFTRTQQFRRLTLSNASGDFQQNGERLSVSKFVAESDGLIRMEGSFIVEKGQIDGMFQVGVTPGSLQWLPGAQAKVFTESRGGYLWAPMRLTGAVNKPTDDLTPRLVAAAQGAVIEGVQNAAGEVLKTGKDAVKGALDLLLPGTK